MSQPTDSNGDELQDRLMDQALGELLGGETPPDLSARILAAVEKQVHVSPQPREPVMEKSKRSRRSWALVGVAACVLVAVGIGLMLPAVYSARESSRELAHMSKAAKPATSAESRTGQVVASSSPVSDTTRSEVQSEPAKRADEEGFISALEAVDRSSIPSSSKKPLVFPDAKRWSELTARRKSASAQPLTPATSALPPTELSITDRPSESAKKLGRPYGKNDGAQWFGARRRLSEKQPKDARESGDDLMLMVTPRIIVQEEEEEQLDRSSASGQGPGRGGDKYDRLVENAFQSVKDHPLSTFSIDVDTASYANVRRFLLEEGRLPPPDAVRIEELVNYFDYDYAGPKDDVPFAAHIEVAACPWAEGHRLVRIGLKGKEIPSEARPECNLVFLLDVSGSMDSPDKLPLLKAGMKMLAKQLRDQDRVAIVVYAGSEGLVLPSTPGSKREKILAALDGLQAGGSTNGGAGIELAYRIAKENFVPGGVNRVLLCTDGDFNVGTTSTGDLVRTVEEKAKSGVFLSVLGFGRGNLNDSMMETISNKGNGNYAYVDGLTEARKVLVRQMGGTLVTIAKDVKIQIEFNPAQVAAYRLIGYENRMLAAEDFNDDKKDAGEIGAGHTVTALYELVPAGQKVDTPPVDPLKYQDAAKPADEKPGSGELLTLKLRYKEPEADTSKRLEFPVVDSGEKIGQASPDFQFAASVAAFGMLLRGSEHKGGATYDAVLEMAASSEGPDLHGYRAEFLELVRRAKALGPR